MSDLIDADGFRANVGILLMHHELVFLGRRTGGRGWQFPQGGVRRGESLEQALYRELEEEIGIAKSEVALIGQTERWLRYRLPARYVRRNQQPVCIGQKQRWFLLQLKPEDPKFDFSRTPEPEFDQFRWAHYWEPVKEVIYFKRAVYARALTELADLAFPVGARPPHPQWWERMTARGRQQAGAPAD
ncbi:MAG: RNA pyrophosphohydrolase [Gammaproteobacteria bacterium]|nr:RNA pyrophosphohydrolase [Gammaproteobacteria bacterium]